MNSDEITLEALKLFRILNGKGDSGSERVFWAQHPDDWMRLAKHVLRRIDKAGGLAYGPRSHDC